MGALELILVVLVCMGASAFFSGAEISMLAVDRAAMIRQVREDSPNAALPEKFVKRPQWFLAATLVGGTISLVGAVVPAALFGASRLGPAGAAAAFALLAPLFLLFARVIPKMYFLPRANRAMPGMLPAIRLFGLVFFPLLLVLLGVMRLAEAFTGRGSNGGLWYTREELRLLLSSAASRMAPGDEGRHMVERIFEFSETLVDEVMVPLVEVEAVEEDAAVGEALRRISQSMYSVYPVYRDRIDNFVGTIETVDLLDVEDLSSPVKKWMSRVRYVPYIKPADELLYEMQRENFTFAVVVDEYGGCIGIVTREDIMEEVVGEIEDEHDRPVVLYRRLDQNRVVMNSRMEIDDANQIMGWELPEGEYDTVGGFLLSLFRRVPRSGERIRYRDFMFTIREANEKAIQEVCVEQVKNGSRDEKSQRD